MTQTTPLTHREIWELIPWVVNGTATPAQKQDVARHLEDCADCRDEYALQMQFHDGMNARDEIEHDARPALSRLFVRIDDAETTLAAPAPRARNRSLQWLAAAVVVQAIGLAMLGNALVTRPSTPAGDFRTLTSAAPASAATIRLVPSPQLSLAQLSQLLADNRLRIVESSADGTKLGVASVDEAADVAAIVTQLRSNPAVLLAEPAAGANHAPR